MILIDCLLFFSMPVETPNRPDLVIVHANLVTGPEAQVMEDATIVIADGRITAIDEDTAVDQWDARAVIDATGQTVMAGFWNCHVHFTEPAWNQAPIQDDEALSQALAERFLQYGFISVIDTGSVLSNTLEIRRRIESGAIGGPQIRLMSGSFVAEDGTPVYMPVTLPELVDGAQAKALTRATLERGADGIKIFSGSFLGGDQRAYLPVALIQAVTDQAHLLDKPVFAHPQSLTGVMHAVHGGVDVLAHTAPESGTWPESLVREMVERKVALTPTLQLWRWELGRADVPETVIQRFERDATAQLGSFLSAGGEILFGTDVGYMTAYDSTDEYRLMARVMTAREILAALTVNPARRFSGHSGTVAVGEPADLVISSGNPLADVTQFARISHAIRGGSILYMR